MKGQNYNLLLKNERIVQSLFDNLHPKTLRVIKEELKAENNKKPEPPFTWNQFYTIVGAITALFTVLSFMIRWDVLLVQYLSFWVFLVIYQNGWLTPKDRKEVNVYTERGKIKVSKIN